MAEQLGLNFDLQRHRLSEYGPLLFGHDGTTVTGEASHYDARSNTVHLPDNQAAGYYTIEDSSGFSYETADDPEVLYSSQVTTVVDKNTKISGLLVIRVGDRVALERGVRTVSRGSMSSEYVTAAKESAGRKLAERWRLGQTAIEG